MLYVDIQHIYNYTYYNYIYIVVNILLDLQDSEENMILKICNIRQQKKARYWGRYSLGIFFKKMDRKKTDVI